MDVATGGGTKIMNFFAYILNHFPLLLSLQGILIALILISILLFKSKQTLALVGLLGVILSALITIPMAICAILEQALVVNFYSSNFLQVITLQIDGLTAWFIIIINLVGILTAIYGKAYLEHTHKNQAFLRFHWLNFFLFYSSMLWICIFQHSLLFLVTWEVMSITSMLLIIYDNDDKKVIQAAINYFVQMHISVLLLTIAFLWVYTEQHSFDFSAIRNFFQSNNDILIFLLFFAGFSIKAGFFTLHTWLPHAHPAAPSHISGMMSGVIVKMGIYGILRMSGFLANNFTILGIIIITLSLLTGIFGIFNASLQRDYKKILAYCTIENIGIIGLGIGMGLIGMGLKNSMLYFLGMGGALLHILNHALYKPLLFYNVGGIYKITHTRDIENLGGLIKNMPKTAIIFLIGAFAICGLPIFNGFISKYLLYVGFINGLKSASNYYDVLFVVTLLGMVLMGGMAIFAFTRSFAIIFLGFPRKQLQPPPQEVNNNMLIPQIIVIILMLCIALFPQVFLQMILKILIRYNFAAINDVEIISTIGNSAQQISWFSLLFIVIIAVLFFIRKKIVTKNIMVSSDTWGCGYKHENVLFQYTGKSFSKNFHKLFPLILHEEKEYQAIESNEIYPEKRKHFTIFSDIWEKIGIQPITIFIRKLIDYFVFIQNGKIQAYVLYGLVFMLIVFIISIF